MRDIAYYNGIIGRIDEVMAPITDRGFYFGDGVYDAAMVRNKKIFALDDHLDRFYNSLKLLRIDPPMERGELAAVLNDLVGRLDTDAPHMLYWQSTRAVAHRLPHRRQGQPDGFCRALRARQTESALSAHYSRGHTLFAL